MCIFRLFFTLFQPTNSGIGQISPLGEHESVKKIVELISPRFSYFAVHGRYVEYYDYQGCQCSCRRRQPETARSAAEPAQRADIHLTQEEHRHNCKKICRHTRPNHKIPVWSRHLTGIITQHQERMEFVAVLLKYQRHTQKQYEYGKQGYQRSYRKHYTHNHFQQIGGGAAALVAGYLKVVAIEIFVDGDIAGAIHIYYKA